MPKTWCKKLSALSEGRDDIRVGGRRAGLNRRRSIDALAPLGNRQNYSQLRGLDGGCILCRIATCACNHASLLDTCLPDCIKYHHKYHHRLFTTESELAEIDGGDFSVDVQVDVLLFISPCFRVAALSDFQVGLE